jgi:hypothetical protein
MRHLLLILTAAIAALGADVTGKWAFQVELSAGSGTAQYEFKQDGEKLTGTYTGALGTANLTGTVKGNEIQFSVKASYDDQEVPISVTGTVEGTKMKGKTKYGQLGEGTFTAVRN